jgi:hypothetical protein
MATATFTTSKADLPIRVGVFASIDSARVAVEKLLNIGFSVEQITVMCSDEMKEQYFREFEHQRPAGTNTPAAAAAGGTLGALLAGATVIVAAGATGGVALLAAGGVSAWAGGVVGGLVGAMMTRGVEKELANYYNQAVLEGKLLVAAEADGPTAPAKLSRAEFVFAETGAEPLALPEG